ncbi:MAG: hypothetical protein FJ221_18845 [Lentisphaerae bacterium]|nr:hypothetical protein [Lentisphaerota bacterium]
MNPMDPALRLSALLALAAGLSPHVPARAADADRQQPFIAALTSGVPSAEKAIACKRLALLGDKAAVPALAPLLADPELASWARIALEAIPDAEAAAALRAALGTLKGTLRVGAIHSLGARRDAASVGALTALLADADPDAASAAAVALGRIGGPAAVAALSKSLSGAPAAVKPAVAEGCLVCAARFLDAGAFADALRLYEAVRGAGVSVPLTLEATRGVILARRDDGIPLLVEQLRSADKASFRIGLRTAREVVGDRVARMLLDELSRAAPERKPHLLYVLADRGDAAAQPVALQAAGAGDAPVRIAAMAVLERLGDRASLSVLLTAAADADPDVAGAARTALARWPGADVDAALLAALQAPEPAVRRTAIELIGQRQVVGAIPALLRVAGEADEALRIAAIKILGEIAGPPDIPALVALLGTTGDSALVEGAVRAIGARYSRVASGQVVIRKAMYGALPGGPSADVTAKVAKMVKSGAMTVDASNGNFGDPAGGVVKKLSVEYTVNGVPCTQTVVENGSLAFASSVAPPEVIDPIHAALAGSQAPKRLALLRILRALGGVRALEAVRAAAADADAGIRDASLRMLCDWPTADALDDLVRLARDSGDAAIRTLALRGSVRLAQLDDVPAAGRIAALRQAMSLAAGDEDRKLALSALGASASVEALAQVVPHLASAGLKEEAALAAVLIAEKLSAPRPPEVAAAMARVIAATSDKDLAKRARTLSGQ